MPPKQPILPFVSVFGVRINLISMQNALSLVEKWGKSNKQHQISTPNPEQLMLAQKNPVFLKVLNLSDLNIPDGAGLVWAINKKLNNQRGQQGRTPQFCGVRPCERIPGVDFMLALCSLAAEKGWRVFLLGGKPDVVKTAAVKLSSELNWENKKDGSHNSTGFVLGKSGKKTPGVEGPEAAFFSGAADIRQETQAEREESIRRINAFKPHLLFVAYGAPYQELWIAKNLPKLKVKVAMSVGGAFDYISGRTKRAPLWARRAGLEWLFRLVREPWRLGRMIKGARFFFLALK